MIFSEIIKIVLINMNSNKMRVALTGLGIIVGALTIIFVLGIGRKSQQDIQEQYRNLNVSAINIMSMNGRMFGGGASKKTITFTKDDAAFLLNDSQYLADAQITANGNTQVTTDKDSKSYEVVASMSQYATQNSLELQYGSYFSDNDDTKKEKVVVLGNTVAQYFYGDDFQDITGQFITVNNKKFRIIGVLASKGDTGIDEAVYIPYDTAKKYVLGARSMTRLVAYAKEPSMVADAKEEIMINLAKKYDTSTVLTRDAGSRVNAAVQSANTMTLMLMSIAVLVLIVGGIGIMNVLLVSVKERTREIGILKAIGTKRTDILKIFLFEAIMISTGAAVISIAVSLIAVPLIKELGFTIINGLEDFILAVAFALITGIFFGYYPAQKASQLKPIDALRYE